MFKITKIVRAEVHSGSSTARHWAPDAPLLTSGARRCHHAAEIGCSGFPSPGQNWRAVRRLGSMCARM